MSNSLISPYSYASITNPFGYKKSNPYSLNMPSLTPLDMSKTNSMLRGIGVIPKIPDYSIKYNPMYSQPAKAGGAGLLGKVQPIMGKAMAGLGILNAGLEAFNGNSKTKDTSAFDTEINSRSTIKADNSSIDGLLAGWNNYTDMDHIGINDVRTGAGEKIGNSISGILGGAAAGLSLGPIGALAGAGVGLVSSIAGWIKGDTEAYEKMKKINAQIDRVNTEANNRFNNAVSNIESIQDDRLASNFYANGGEMGSSFDAMKQTEIFKRFHKAKQNQEGLRQFWYDDHVAPNRQTAIGKGDGLASSLSVPTIGYGMTVGALRGIASSFKDADAINAVRAFDNGDRSFRITPEMALKFTDLRMRQDYDLIKKNINTQGMSPEQIASLMYIAYDKPKAISDGSAFNSISDPTHRYSNILNQYKSRYIKPGSGRENGFNSVHGQLSLNSMTRRMNRTSDNPERVNGAGTGIDSQVVDEPGMNQELLAALISGGFSYRSNSGNESSYEQGVSDRVKELIQEEARVKKFMLKMYDEIYGKRE